MLHNLILLKLLQEDNNGEFLPLSQIFANKSFTPLQGQVLHSWETNSMEKCKY